MFGEQSESAVHAWHVFVPVLQIGVFPLHCAFVSHWTHTLAGPQTVPDVQSVVAPTVRHPQPPVATLVTGAAAVEQRWPNWLTVQFEFAVHTAHTFEELQKGAVSLGQSVSVRHATHLPVAVLQSGVLEKRAQSLFTLHAPHVSLLVHVGAAAPHCELSALSQATHAPCLASPTKSQIVPLPHCVFDEQGPHRFAVVDPHTGKDDPQSVLIPVRHPHSPAGIPLGAHRCPNVLVVQLAFAVHDAHTPDVLQ
jgi:hypothetical protein